MNKRLIAIILSVVSVIGTTAFAEESITACEENNSVVWQKQDWMSDSAVVSYYDADGKLIYSSLGENKDNQFTAPKKGDYAKVRAWFTGNENVVDMDVQKTTPNPTDVPTETQAPTATAAPTNTPEATNLPTNSPAAYPSIYSRQKNAVEAFAVVEKVVQSQVDGEDVSIITSYYQGQEKDIVVKNSVLFETASDNSADMIGKSAESLKKGDVFRFACSLSGDVRHLYFIYRPVSEDIITSDNDYGSSFEKLISSNGVVAGEKSWEVSKYGSNSSAKEKYAFGVVTNRQGNTLTLYNKGGKGANLQELSLQNDTIVYVCDTSRKTLGLSIGNVASISKSSIPRSAFDDEDNITFSDSFEYTYVLARIIDDTVTDIIVYRNEQ